MGDVVKAKIRKWFGDKGFGFARPVDAGPRERDRDVFVHARSLDPSLQHLTRLDYPVMTAEGRPDFANSPAWPAELFIEAEPNEKGMRALRVSETEFKPGELGAGPLGGGTMSAGASPNLAGPRAAPRSQRGPQEDVRRPKFGDKGGGGRRGSWGSRDDDF